MLLAPLHTDSWNCEFLQSTPQLVEALPLEEDLVKVSCGARHTVVLTGQPPFLERKTFFTSTSAG